MAGRVPACRAHGQDITNRKTHEGVEILRSKIAGTRMRLESRELRSSVAIRIITLM